MEPVTVSKRQNEIGNVDISEKYINNKLYIFVRGGPEKRESSKKTKNKNVFPRVLRSNTKTEVHAAIKDLEDDGMRPVMEC